MQVPARTGKFDRQVPAFDSGIFAFDRREVQAFAVYSLNLKLEAEKTGSGPGRT